jgi:hypothetical protein
VALVQPLFVPVVLLVLVWSMLKLKLATLVPAFPFAVIV